MKGAKRIRNFYILLIAWIVIVFLGNIVINHFFGNTMMRSFTESSRELRNPDRGFYNIYRFMIADDRVDYWQLIEELYMPDQHTSLSLIEINLQNYRDGEISEAGIANIESLFQALRALDKQLIVRFLYDWNGENVKYEPETIGIILRHMEQMEKVLQEHDEQIFILQGLFIGNWGEMNGTKYSSDIDLIRLAQQLDQAAGPSAYLAVRTPSQWRRITGLESVPDTLEDYPLAGRMSLYNDGMLGNESDYGTYRVSEVKGNVFSSREEELDFQEKLCSLVPNGGEVINDNDLNDFGNAVEALAQMHVTYLNEGHDQTVLDKWKNTKVTESGCYKGMDGYTYIERHLGYRLLLEKSYYDCDTFAHKLEIKVRMRNVGFAPLYTQPEVRLVLFNKDLGEYLEVAMEGDLRSLQGGNDAERSEELRAEISLDKLSDAVYEAYLSVTDPDTEQRILLAIDQDMEEDGYYIGSVDLAD